MGIFICFRTNAEASLSGKQQRIAHFPPVKSSCANKVAEKQKQTAHCNEMDTATSLDVSTQNHPGLLTADGCAVSLPISVAVAFARNVVNDYVFARVAGVSVDRGCIRSVNEVRYDRTGAILNVPKPEPFDQIRYSSDQNSVAIMPMPRQGDVRVTARIVSRDLMAEFVLGASKFHTVHLDGSRQCAVDFLGELTSAPGGMIPQPMNFVLPRRSCQKNSASGSLVAIEVGKDHTNPRWAIVSDQLYHLTQLLREGASERLRKQRRVPEGEPMVPDHILGGGFLVTNPVRNHGRAGAVAFAARLTKPPIEFVPPVTTEMYANWCDWLAFIALVVVFQTEPTWRNAPTLCGIRALSWDLPPFPAPPSGILRDVLHAAAEEVEADIEDDTISGGSSESDADEFVFEEFAMRCLGSADA